MNKYEIGVLGNARPQKAEEPRGTLKLNPAFEDAVRAMVTEREEQDVRREGKSGGAENEVL